VILFGLETWSLTLRKKYRLISFKKRVPKRLFGQKRYEVTGSWKNLHNEELGNLYSYPSVITMMK
jgi:hypothetical protein